MEGDHLPHYVAPLELTSSHSSSALQPLSNGRLLFTKSSLTSPNDVFILRRLDHLERDLTVHKSVIYRGQPEQLTRFNEDALKGKNLDEGEDIWFKSAGNDVHGWILKPKGWKPGEKQKWPVLMLVHGGLLDVLLLRKTPVNGLYTKDHRALGNRRGRLSIVSISTFLHSKAIS